MTLLDGARFGLQSSLTFSSPFSILYVCIRSPRFLLVSRSVECRFLIALRNPGCAFGGEFLWHVSAPSLACLYLVEGSVSRLVQRIPSEGVLVRCKTVSRR